MDPSEAAPPEAAPPQAATDSIYSSLGLEEGRTNRFGIHVVEDAEVIAAQLRVVTMRMTKSSKITIHPRIQRSLSRGN